jgi:hypothetical protein
VKLLRCEGVQNLVAHFFRVSKFNQWKGLRSGALGLDVDQKCRGEVPPSVAQPIRSD